MPQQHLNVVLPPDQVGGVYADFIQVWHSQDVFTLDFSALSAPPELAPATEGEEAAVVLNAQVVARVRIPPSQVFEIMKALEHQLTRWESEQAQDRTGGE